jgi:hypothetical protein
VTPAAVREYVDTLRPRYTAASRPTKQQILDEFCATTRYNRKSAIRALHAPAPMPGKRPGRPPIYDAQTAAVLTKIWEAAGFPWSVRLKALLPLWLPWAVRRFGIVPHRARQLRTMSPSTMDRLLRARKQQIRHRLYGRTKPGTLLKHHIPIKSDRWTTVPGFAEVDLVAHSGPAGDGDFIQSVNLTDIHTTWVETRAVLGRGQRAVCAAIDDIRTTLPFPLRGLDSDNGTEFINDQLFRYCQAQAIQFTRGRPYEKDDNAHIEQKNWTHVRKLLGTLRYDSPEALAAINDLYRNELRLMMNLFQPSVKLQRKVRVGSRVRRLYAAPQTPLDRVLASASTDPERVQALKRLRDQLDPFALAHAIDRKLTAIYQLASRHHTAQALRPGKPFRIRSAWAQVSSNGAHAPVTGVMTR